MQLPLVPAELFVKPWPPLLATRGPGWAPAMRAHHAMHFVLALDGRLRARSSHRGRWSTAAGVLTSPDSPHAIDARGVEMLVIFFDPESDVGAALWPGMQVPIRLISERERAELLRGMEDFRSLESPEAARWA